MNVDKKDVPLNAYPYFGKGGTERDWCSLSFHSSPVRWICAAKVRTFFELCKSVKIGIPHQCLKIPMYAYKIPIKILLFIQNKNKGKGLVHIPLTLNWLII